MSVIPNDQRGWILASISGLACVLGACFINLDIILHVVPSWRSFNIRQSTTFLAASLSLSFGVMFFSALVTLLPEATSYFLRSEYAANEAKLMAVAFFLVGVLGLQVVSELLHRCLPSSIVTCEDHGGLGGEHSHGGLHDARLEVGAVPPVTLAVELSDDEETTPLLDRRPTLRYARSFLRNHCANGKCYGYADHPCDQFCSIDRSKKVASESLSTTETPRTHSHIHPMHDGHIHPHGSEHDHMLQSHDHGQGSGHHHVPDNKFLSIGVQTSIAIALHKFPEGFITYATNHANPVLGFNVFIALFIHNIAEGFAMSLPLFLALGSRTKAVVWASLLGGLAQPMGAFIAWLSIRGRDVEMNYAIYGTLFSVTSGIMCSVGLQLFSQAIRLHHGSRLSFVFAFTGMAIMGLSSAITAQ